MPRYTPADPPEDTLRGYFRAAIAHHLRTWAWVTEVGEAALCIYLIALGAGDMTPDVFMLYPGIFALVVAGTLAYRRTIACRSERSYVDLGKVRNRQALLFGEALACFVMSAVLIAATIAAGVVLAPGKVGSAGVLAVGYILILINAAAAVMVTFLFSGLVLPSDAPSVLSIVVLVLGASRSSLSAEIMQSVPAESLVFATRLLTPPFEEVTKCAMHGTLALDWAYVVQTVIYACLAAYISSALFARRALAGGRTIPARAPRPKKEPHTS